MKKTESHTHNKPIIEKGVPVPEDGRNAKGEIAKAISSMDLKDCATFKGLSKKARSSVGAVWLSTARRNNMKMISRSLPEPGGTFTLRLWRVK